MPKELVRDPKPQREVAEGTVAIARISPAGDQPPFDLTGSFRECIVPGTEVTRYGRIWHMTRFDEEGGFLYGRIGYEEEGSTEELWNDKIKDFEERQTKLGATAMYAVSLPALRIAFQLKSDRIRPQTFIGNFQALLNEIGGETYRWRVTPDVANISWPDWLATVDRVTELRIKVKRPNPNWAGRKHLEKLVEGTNTKLIHLVLRAREDSPEGIDVSEEMIAEAIDHANHDYGTYKARGETHEGKKVTAKQWDAAVDGEPQQQRVPLDPTSGEVSRTTLRRELQRKKQPPKGAAEKRPRESSNGKPRRARKK